MRNINDVKLYYFEDDGSIPNNTELALLFYEEALLKEDRSPTAVKRLLKKHKWSGAWVDSIYSYHHYHSTAHEVLAATQGYAEVRFGGENGTTVKFQAADVVVIPAGVGHCRVNSSADFQVVGAYPDGQEWDLCTGKPGERPKVLENIRSVPLPSTDPVTGTREPLLRYWFEA